MEEYIEEINDPNLQPLSWIPMSFDPKSPANLKTLEQIQKYRLIMETAMEWLERILKSSAKYFVNLRRVYDGVIQVMKELEVEIINWKNEKAKWASKEV